MIAPAGPFDRTLFFRGLGWLAEHFRVRFEPGCTTKTGYLAGTDERRLTELNRALRCTESSVIVAARGGYGCTRIAAQADFAALRRHPKWLVGFSDITALHCEALRHRVASLHAANVTGLGRGDAEGRQAWLAAVTGASSQRQAGAIELEPQYPGLAQGALIGGNLTLIESCAAQGRLRVPRGAILFFEEVGEQPYRIDRLFTTLGHSGVFDQLGGMLLGQFTACRGGRDHPTPERLAREWARRHELPCASGVPAGHELRNLPLRLGTPVRLRVSSDSAVLELAPLIS